MISTSDTGLASCYALCLSSTFARPHRLAVPNIWLVKDVLASKLVKQLKPTANWNTVWADVGRIQGQPQNHNSNAKSKLIFITNWGSLKQHPDRSTQVGMQALWTSVHARESLNLLISSLFQGFMQPSFTTVLWSFPQQGRNLKHVWCVQMSLSQSQARLI